MNDRLPDAVTLDRNGWHRRAEALTAAHPQEALLLGPLFNLAALQERLGWTGACHATTAVLYVLVREIGIERVAPVIGEASRWEGCMGPLLAGCGWCDLGRGDVPTVTRCANPRCKRSDRAGRGLSHGRAASHRLRYAHRPHLSRRCAGDPADVLWGLSERLSRVSFGPLRHGQGRRATIGPVPEPRAREVPVRPPGLDRCP